MDNKDQEFKNLMKNYRPEKAPVDFSKKVMDEVYRQEKVTEYKPLFGKWFIHVFVALFTVFVVYASWGTSSSNNGSKITGYLEKLPQADWTALDNIGNSVTSFLGQIPHVFVLALLALTLLLFVDRWLQLYRIRRQ